MNPDDDSVVVDPTVVLIGRVQACDVHARDMLLRRLLPLLQRWVHGRLPRAMRDLNETHRYTSTACVRAGTL